MHFIIMGLMLGRDSLPVDEKLKPVINDNIVRDAYRISYLANFFSGPLYVDLEAKLGLTRTEVVILIMLAHVDGLAAKDICQMSGRPKNSVSRAVHRLQQKTMIKRRPDKEDGRRFLLSLTARGRKTYEAFIPAFVEREAIMLESLSASERRVLDQLLTKLIDESDTWARIY